MAIETGLRSLLMGQASITALVPAQTIGGTTYPGVFNEFPVQGFQPPYILIAKISETPWLNLGNSLGTHPTDFDIDCYSVTFAESVAMAAAVKTFLEDYTGPCGPDNTIKAVLWDGGRHDVVAEEQGRDVRHHIESTSWIIQHT